MPDKKLNFEFKARAVKVGQADVLEVEVRNAEAEAWAGPVVIELKLPTETAATSLRQAAKSARTSESPKNMVSLSGVVSGADGWTVWAVNDPNDHVVVIRAFNSGIDPDTAKPTGAQAAFAAGATLKLPVPLSPQAPETLFTLRYGYQTGRGKDARVDGSLDIVPTSHGDWSPQVSLTCDYTSPTMLPPGKPVKISWSVKNGVSATLRGPLPGGNSELRLSRDAASNYRMEEGSLSIIAVGPATYLLDAEVKGPEGKSNVQVIRALTLDIFSVDNYAYLNVRPGSILPNGQVEIDWAVWGVESAAIKLGTRLKLNLELTEQNLSRWYQGTGVWRVHARGDMRSDQPSEPVRLFITTDGQETFWKDTAIIANPWEKIEEKRVFEGKPLALAVTDGHMALLTSSGLWTAEVGKGDKDLKDPDFKKSQIAGKAWYALGALGNNFVLLRQTEGGDVVLERYNTKRERIKLPVTLPGDFQSLARRTGASFDLVCFGNRAYVVVNAYLPNRWGRVAYSVGFEPSENVRYEESLSTLGQYRLISFDNALYAFHRGNGRMLRFGLTSTGELAPPTRAASAVNSDNVSMIKTGLLVPVGSVLVVLDPAALPALQSLPLVSLLNVAEFSLENLRPQLKSGEIPQDLVYNPQQDSWAPCGRALRMQAGAVAAYRGGEAERLWALQPDGEMHKLVDATEKLFTPEFVKRFPAKVLPAACDAVREFTLVNMTGIDLVPLDDVCRAAGLASIETEGVATLAAAAPERLPHTARHNFKVAYSKENPAPVNLRFMAEGCEGARYFMEVTLSGPELQFTSSGFKRLAPDGSVAAVPGTATRHGGNEIKLNMPGQLTDKTWLYVVNSSPYELALNPNFGRSKVEDSAPVEVSYKTPSFKVFAHGMESLGHYLVELDFTKPAQSEVTPGSAPQMSRIRINTDNAGKLDVTSQYFAKPFAGQTSFDRYNGSKFKLTPPPPGEVFTCQVRLSSKMALDGVRLGDGALTRDGKSLFVPLAKPDDVSKVRVVRVDLDTRLTGELAVNTRGNVFSVPNAVAVSDRGVYAMFGEPVYHQATHVFDGPTKVTLDNIAQVVAFAASQGGSVYYIAKKTETAPGCSLWVHQHPENVKTEISLGDLCGRVPPMAVSPDGKTVAVGDQSGLLVIDVPTKRVQQVKNYELRDPTHVVFSPDGQWIYSAHMEVALNMNPRRAVFASDVALMRVRVARPTETQTLQLADMQSDIGLTVNTQANPPAGGTSKEQYSLTLAVTPDNRSIFVSWGAVVWRVAADTFTRQQWSANVELPCRLVGVTEGAGNTWRVLALGSYYVGDGTRTNEYKTHLYFVTSPKG
ncbi:MAG TPA: hypothetical protein VF297_30010 [Pyrinomonadaceae bacterium]